MIVVSNISDTCSAPTYVSVSSARLHVSTLYVYDNCFVLLTAYLHRMQKEDTPLLSAVRKGRKETVTLLLENGADTNMLPVSQSVSHRVSIQYVFTLVE
jgi:hypothetical protein